MEQLWLSLKSVVKWSEAEQKGKMQMVQFFKKSRRE
jgi:hypothetical protein